MLFSHRSHHRITWETNSIHFPLNPDISSITWEFLWRPTTGTAEEPLSVLEGRGGVGATAKLSFEPGDEPEPRREGVPTLTESDGDLRGDEFGVPLAEKVVVVVVPTTSFRGEPNGVPLAEPPPATEPSR